MKLREIADENEILLIFDEVQAGFGITGKFWASDHYVKPDIIAFGKKAQVCGIMASARIDDVPENCFHKSSRLNSTWGANLVDMVRSKHILKIIDEEALVENSKIMGAIVLDDLLNRQIHVCREKRATHCVFRKTQTTRTGHLSVLSMTVCEKALTSLYFP